MSYITMTVKIEEDDIREHLSNFYDEEDIENMNIKSEATNVVDAILSDHFSDYAVIDNETIIIGDWD